jgi:two-component SAPR family response regulator
MFHVVDDEGFVCKIFVKILKSAGYEALSFTNPEEYLEYVKSESYVKPIAIFTDIVMPEMNGFELIDKVREFEPDVKIVVLSGLSKNQSKSKKRICHYLLKPVHRKLLTETIEILAKCDETNWDDWQCPLDYFDCNKNPNIIQK